MSSFAREIALIGENSFARLSCAKVAVVGLGGVGSYAAEAIVRAGVGTIIAVDSDVVDQTNLNRQLFALHSTIGCKKTDVFAARALDINPQAKIIAHDVFLNESNIEQIITDDIDFVIDAIDTVTSKLELICHCKRKGIPMISSLGTGNKLQTAFQVTDLFETRNDPLARVLRRELRRRDITSLPVVYSAETPQNAVFNGNGRHAPASISYVPGSAGLMLAGYVIRALA